jgi:hypothetical protein
MATAPVAAGAVTFFLVAILTERGMTLMTVRRSDAYGNTKGAKSGLPGPASCRALLTLRAAVILLGGLVTGVATGVLTYFVVHSLPAAVLAGIPACAGAIKFLDALIA